jgi:arsenate reductase
MNILVLCTGNSCRSQMAHGYLKQMGGPGVQVYSAGVETHGLNPFAVGIMAEDGVDISQHTSNHVDEYREIAFDIVLTVCDHAREVCPYFPSNAKLFHHDFTDPTKAVGTVPELIKAFRQTRDEIKRYCANLLTQYA